MSHRRFSPSRRSPLHPRSAWLLPFAGLLTAGCATAPAAPNRSAELERNMVELRAQNSGYLRQIDELQNRIFILENKIENSLRVADENRRTGPISRTLVEEDAGRTLIARPRAPSPRRRTSFRTPMARRSSTPARPRSRPIAAGPARRCACRATAARSSPTWP